MRFHWTILLRGKNGRPYNVGSARDRSISEIAQAVNHAFENKLAILVAQQPTLDRAPERYVPSTSRAAEELNLRETISLGEAIRKTVAWNAGRIPSKSDESPI